MIKIIYERVIDGEPARPVVELSGPKAGLASCGDGSHCACHGCETFFCCRCGSTFRFATFKELRDAEAKSVRV